MESYPVGVVVVNAIAEQKVLGVPVWKNILLVFPNKNLTAAVTESGVVPDGNILTLINYNMGLNYNGWNLVELLDTLLLPASGISSVKFFFFLLGKQSVTYYIYLNKPQWSHKNVQPLMHAQNDKESVYKVKVRQSICICKQLIKFKFIESWLLSSDLLRTHRIYYYACLLINNYLHHHHRHITRKTFLLDISFP